jgi:hypothetical protein
MIDPFDRNEMVVLAIGRTRLGQLDLVSIEMIDLADGFPVRRNDVHMFFDLRGIDHPENSVADIHVNARTVGGLRHCPDREL